MSKRKSPTIVFDEDGHAFAVNRAAKKRFKAMNVKHTPIHMVPWTAEPVYTADGSKQKRYWTTWGNEAMEMQPLYAPKRDKRKY